MQTVYDEICLAGQARYNGIRRKVQYFSTFAGGVIEALRESGFRLCSFEKQPAFYDLASPHRGSVTAPQPARRQGNGNIELYFEQADRDQCKVLIVPYRSDLPFLAKGRFVAQLGLELSRYCNDPDTLRQAVAVNAKASFGSFLGGARLPKLYLDSPGDIKPPGTMTFELHGARLVVAVNILANLGKYRMTDMELDIDAIREDLQVYFYGLEKYLALLLQNFGAKVELIDDPQAEEVAEQTAAPIERAPVAPPSPPRMGGAPLPIRAPSSDLGLGGTVPLNPSQGPPPNPTVGGTVPLDPSQGLPPNLAAGGTVPLGHIPPSPPLAGAPRPPRPPG